MSKYSTESFNVDHTKMKAPNIRVAGSYERGGVKVTKLDIRFCTPNKEILSREAMHTIEHLFAEVAHGTNDSIIDFSPMGCGTGFYLTFFGEPDEMFDFVIETFRLCTLLSVIPAVTPKECGNYKLHSLSEAHEALSKFLNNLSN